MKVSGVEVVPDPVVRGEPATFKISASTGNQSIRCDGLASVLRISDSESICRIR